MELYLMTQGRYYSDSYYFTIAYAIIWRQA